MFSCRVDMSRDLYLNIRNQSYTFYFESSWSRVLNRENLGFLKLKHRYVITDLILNHLTKVVSFYNFSERI